MPNITKINEDTTIVIVVEDNNYSKTLSCLWSVFELNSTPYEIIIVCGQSDITHKLLDICEVRNCSLVKTKNLLDSQKIKTLVSTRYLLRISNKAVVYNENLFSIIEGMMAGSKEKRIYLGKNNHIFFERLY